MAQVNPGVPVPEPTTFAELFNSMPDVYNGTYQRFLNEYDVNNAQPGTALLLNTITRFPMTQVPALFAYVGTDGLISTVHHIHRVEVPFGQPSPWLDAMIGFKGEIHNTQIAYVQVGVDTFFDNTDPVRVPTVATMGAAYAALAAGTINVGPYDDNAPDTEEVQCRRAIPVPYAYVPLMFGRDLTPQQAWEQVGAQIILDQREADCSLFLTFLRVAGTARRGRPRTPANMQPQALNQPMGDPTLLGHIGRKLRQLLPVVVASAATLGPQFAQATQVLRQALQEDRELERANRAVVAEAERAIAAEAEGNALSFSVVFPSVAESIRRLCDAGDDDDLLPEFWQAFARAKGKKAQTLASLTQLANSRANEHDSSQKKPVITTQLFTQVANFELGTSDLTIITNGVSPFIVCPMGYHKAAMEQALARQYIMIHNDTGTPALADVQQLLSPNYHLPDSLHQLADFLGAYSVVWDVLVGPGNPIAIAVRNHFTYWHQMASQLHAELGSPQMEGRIMIGTLRAVQLEIMGYVNRKLDGVHPLSPPSLTHIEDAIGRGIYTLPALPQRYYQTTTAPAGVTQTAPPSTPEAATTTTKSSGNPVNAPSDHHVAAWHDAFANSSKSVQQLKALPPSKRPKAGKSFACLSYHLRGSCYDNCRFSPSHRKLTEKEQVAMQKLVDTEL